ncbi:ABC-2 type transport system permease protein [Enterococcus sp. PF1-24]|uniref:ABC transporter permease n=1 Tax=unclassified Enterococcus TaxID=2608891 RepID=UPI002476025E|nr:MULTISPECIES: ABC transporter permease [unclassified Enterococcus]MDH6365538.1 ABC-2 type transport system permease protein [Enterococcus sp. PFB1-1]MDH6402639.1 ABC-2 type transport system permease protein [Enterococcus sp. PF1-24]
MTIYKTIAAILKKNFKMLLIGVAISIGISFLYAGQLEKSDEISLRNINVAIFDEDQQTISKDLNQYLGQHMQIEKIKNTTAAKDDALYFQSVEAVLTIPKGFSQALCEGQTPKIDIQTRPGSYSQALITATTENYLNTFAAYQKNLPAAETQELLALVAKTLNVQGKISTNQNNQDLAYRKATANVFNLLAYGLFISVFSGMAYVYLTFNKQELRKRNLCSPISPQKLTQKIFSATMIYSTFLLICFTAYFLMYTKSSWNAYTLFTLINVAVFFLVMVSLSLMVVNLSKNTLITSVFNNTYILGSCFICGIFVPTSFLPDAIVKFSMLTPTYWFTHLNMFIAETGQFDQAFYKEFLFHIVIMFCFIAAFLLITRIQQKEQGGLKSKSLRLS